ncbi:MAG: hypothetical protein GY854_12745 [Deltaproteobacteria bacterium]|nr:hypothetical protein [Deltaproteobacteria bacterium]
MKKLSISSMILVVYVTILAMPIGADAETRDAGVDAKQVSAGLLEPIPDSWKETFAALRPDPRPEKLTRNSHYWISDEKRHDLFQSAIADSGGVFIGLGTDQNYLMAAWARPEILILLDFDQMVVNLHYAFRVLFLNAETPAEFVDMWSFERYEEVRDKIKQAYADRDKKFRRGVLQAFKVARRLVHARLRLIIKTYGKRGIPTFLSDKDQYQYIVRLFETGRVFPIRGDLTASNTVSDVAAAVKKLGLSIGTLYLSNAEQYFKYNGNSFRQNMLALPLDEKSVVIRTAGTRSKWSADGLYEYIVQSGSNFHVWIGHPKTYTVWAIVNARKVNKKTGGSIVTKLPRGKDEKKKK